MSSLAFPSENHAEPPSADSGHDSAISRPRYVVLQSLVGVMLAYQLLSGAELIASRPTSGVIVGGLVAMVLCLLYVPISILQTTWFSGVLMGSILHSSLRQSTFPVTPGRISICRILCSCSLPPRCAGSPMSLGYLCCSVPGMASSSIKGLYKLVLCRPGICWGYRFCW